MERPLPANLRLNGQTVTSFYKTSDSDSPAALGTLNHESGNGDAVTSAVRGAAKTQGVAMEQPLVTKYWEE